MPSPRPEDPATGDHDSRFATTHWSLIVRARASDPAAREALAVLCQRYWYPLYAHIRRSSGPADAADLTQAFFAYLLESDLLSATDSSRGKFRAFLLACCNHFLSNERDKARALKRGGGRLALSLDLDAAASRYSLEPADRLTPELAFVRQWALALLDEAHARVEREYHATGKGELYRLLKPVLIGVADPLGYAGTAGSLGMTVAAVKKAAQRLRESYRGVLRDMVAETVERPEEVDDEIRELMAAVAS